MLIGKVLINMLNWAFKNKDFGRARGTRRTKTFSGRNNLGEIMTSGCKLKMRHKSPGQGTWVSHCIFSK